jgi:hypothetical protein
MQEDTNKNTIDKILKELSEKIISRDSLGRRLDAFIDLPPDKVADAILKQFEYLLTSDLHDLIVHLITQDASVVQADKDIPRVQVISDEVATDIVQQEIESSKDIEIKEGKTNEKLSGEGQEPPSASVMEYFETKELFSTEPMNIELKPEDWFCIYGFCYAPDSAGKGIPTVKLKLKSADKINDIFLLDYGDIRLFLNKLDINNYSLDKLGKPSLNSSLLGHYRFEHEKLLNILRKNELLVPLPLWTVIQKRENIINIVEDKYVQLLRALIDVHDALDWDIELFVLDEHIANHPSMIDSPKSRITQRDAKHHIGKITDVRLLEKIIFREKRLAQDIHSQLLVLAAKFKIDHMIRIDSAMIDDWKSILSVRYNVNKDKRKTFFNSIAKLQSETAEFEVMIRVSSPTVRFSLV